MTRDEAIRLLEDKDVCLDHFQKRVKASGKKHAVCVECEALRERAEQAQIEAAIRVLRGDREPEPAPSLETWTPMTSTLPRINERVYIVLMGFREAGKAGGKEHYVTGKPLFWRRK